MPPPNQEMSSKYYDLLDKELMLRLMDPRGSLERKRKKLRERMEQEIELKLLFRTINVCTPDPNAIVQIHKMIPCILHLEISVGIKIFSMIASHGLSAKADRKKQDDDMRNIEKVLNHNILGTYIQPCQWFFLSKKNKLTGRRIAVCWERSVSLIQ
jgi:hypothetical protein